MKTFIKYILLTSLVFFFSSCLWEEKNLFPESAALRLNHAVDNAKQTLIDQSKNNGWIMEYFPTNDTEGYTFLMSFSDNTFVTVAAKNQYTTGYTTDESAFEIIGDVGPVLTFDTYNEVFHYFSNPDNPQGLGLMGDYEFIIMNISPDNEITLKGKKRETTILMRPLAQGQDWKGYFDILDGMDATIFNPKLPATLTLKGSNDGDSLYYLSNGATHIFTAQTQDQINALDPGSNIPFIITDYGLRFAQPVAMGKDSVQTFKLSDDKNELVCVDEGRNAKITALAPADYFLSFINNRRSMAFVYSDASMSPSVKTTYAVINDGVTAKSRKLEYLQFVNDKTWGASLTIRTSRTGGTNIDGFFSFTMTKNNDSEIALTFNGFTGNYNANGKTYYDTYDGVSNFIGFVEGAYKLNIQGNALMSGLVRLTSTTDPNKWFDLQAK